MPGHVAYLVCGSTRSVRERGFERLLTLDETYGIARCLECGFHFQSPRPTVDELLSMYAVHPYYSPENATGEEGFEILSLRTYVPGHPVYHANPRGAPLQEALYAFGGCLERGAVIEVIARKARRR